MEAFQPDLVLCQESEGQFALHAVTLTPNSCFFAGRSGLGVPFGQVLIPEAQGVILEIRNTGSPVCLPVITPIRHRIANLALGGSSGKDSVVAFAVLDGKVVGTAHIRSTDAANICVFEGVGVMAEICASAEWHAWVRRSHNRMASLLIRGAVLAPTPGYSLSLRRAVPQGFNPRQLILDLEIAPLPGIWPQVVTPMTAAYHEDTDTIGFDTVLIRCGALSSFVVEVDGALPENTELREQIEPPAHRSVSGNSSS